MNISEPFIRRPIGTTLLAVGLFLTGAVAYGFLPVANLPSVDFPTIHVSAGRPGADPATMAATVAAPLERRLGEIAGVTELTSVSSLGSTNITVQFDINRNIDGAARDVQAAINAALSDLPGDLPSRPNFRKSNPAAAPVLILAMTSATLSPAAIYDAADSVVAQRIAQIEGVAEVSVSGAEQPAVRVRLNPVALAKLGIGFSTVQSAIVNANPVGPIGVIEGETQAVTLATNPQMRRADQYKTIVVRGADGTIVRLSDVAEVVSGVRNSRTAGWYNEQPAVLVIVQKEANANVIQTADRIRAMLPELERWIPGDIAISVLSDRTGTIRASVDDLSLTLLAAVALVMMVVFVFLRRGTAVLAAGITVPLSLAGTVAAMWAFGFSIDNLSLMALTISVGFVVDDAIVMIENGVRNMEAGMSPMQAAIAGSRQIGFTVVSISLSLIAAFIPLLFMGGIVGRLFKEFAVTLTLAIAISAVVSLTVTPMICARFMRAVPARDETRLDRMVEGVLTWMIAIYGRSLRLVLRHALLGVGVTFAAIVGTVWLYIDMPKGFFPVDDTGQIAAFTESAPGTSFQAMAQLQRRVSQALLRDPAIAGIASTVGGSGFFSANQGRLFISLKPLAERDVTVFEVIARLRRQMARLPGINVYMGPVQDVRVGGRQGFADNQFTLWTPDLEELTKWTPIVLEKVRTLPGFVDVSSDRQQGGPQVNVVIDRLAASRLGVSLSAIDDTLNTAFAQRQISTVYLPRNQYRVILEIDPQFQTDPTDLQHIFVPGKGGVQIPLGSVAHFENDLAPLRVNHQGQYPAATISYNLAEGVSLSQARADVQLAIANLHLPGTLHAEFAGNARAFADSLGSQPMLVLAAILTIYILLGVLYESVLHPLTILSTLPSAGLGALLALKVSGTDLTLIAMIGIILLIGIVKKNGIILVDFALDAEYRRGLTPENAIFEACMVRFRPIMMTTLAALFGAVPLLLITGAGAELRRPLGITIIGGLVVSQMLTLYTTPVIYLLLDRLKARSRPQLAPQPGE